MLSLFIHGVLHPTMLCGQRQRRIKVVQEDAFSSHAVVVEGGTVDAAGIRGVLTGTASRTIELYFGVSDDLSARSFSINNKTIYGNRYLQSAQVRECWVSPAHLSVHSMVD